MRKTKYYRFPRGEVIHVAFTQDIHRTMFVCGKWKFTHLLHEEKVPSMNWLMCKKCKERRRTNE